MAKKDFKIAFFSLAVFFVFLVNGPGANAQNNRPDLVVENIILHNQPNGAVSLKIWVDPPNLETELREENNVVVTIMMTDTTTGEDLALADEEQVAQEIEEELSEELDDGSEEEETVEEVTGEEGDELDESTEEIVDEELSFEPAILPGNPLYIFKIEKKKKRKN